MPCSQQKRLIKGGVNQETGTDRNICNETKEKMFQQLNRTPWNSVFDVGPNKSPQLLAIENYCLDCVEEPWFKHSNASREGIRRPEQLTAFAVAFVVKTVTMPLEYTRAAEKQCTAHHMCVKRNN